MLNTQVSKSFKNKIKIFLKVWEIPRHGPNFFHPTLAEAAAPVSPFFPGAILAPQPLPTYEAILIIELPPYPLYEAYIAYIH